MLNTASIRSAMRWSLCSAIAIACTTTTRYYVPSEGESRLTPNEVRDQSDALLSTQCPRLMGTSRVATGEARIIVDLNRSGAVQRARVTRTSGDKAMDDIFGALIARLQVDPPTGMNGDTGEHPIYIGYSCSPEANAITLNITGRQNPPIPPTVPPPPRP
jgi:TonB family protein